MTVPYTYLINIELVWKDGTKVTPNQIARVTAHDINGTVVTWQGECGYNPNTTGWYPVYMQHIDQFYPPREQPNLRFTVENTSNAVVHTSRVYECIASGSTVHIVIDGDDWLVTGGSSCPDTPWQVYGTITYADTGEVVTDALVTAYDVTDNHPLPLATAGLTASGAYTITFPTSLFQHNGHLHVYPNLKIQVTTTSGGQLLGETTPVETHQNPKEINLAVARPATGTQCRVYGTVRNSLNLPVCAIDVEAFQIEWTTAGLKETSIGTDTTCSTSSLPRGGYEILYNRPEPSSNANPCGTPPGQLNLVVKATAPDPSDTSKVIEIGASEVVFAASADQQIDLVVERAGSSDDSEYELLDALLTKCLGTNKSSTLAQLDEHPEYLEFVAKSTKVDLEQLRAYVAAWMLSEDIDERTDVEFPTPPEIVPEAIYGLIRLGLGDTLGRLIEVKPERFFSTLVDAIHTGIISGDRETDLPALLEFWRDVLAALMTSSDDEHPQWQDQLLSLVFSSQATKEAVVKAHFDFSGTLVEFCAALPSLVPGVGIGQADDLKFVFEMYDAVGQYVAIVRQVYSGKPSSWKTIKDLAVITVDGDSSHGIKGWFDYARDALLDETVPIPGDLPGKWDPSSNEWEKARLYAERLYKLFGNVAPQDRFVADLVQANSTTGSTYENIGKFLSSNTDFDLGSTNIDAYAENHTVTLTDAEIELLKTLQRIYRLTNDYDAAVYLIGQHLDSAVKISLIHEDQFVVDHEQYVGGLTAAQKIHRTATHYAGETLFTLVKFHQNLNDSGGINALPAAVDFSALARSVTTRAGALTSRALAASSTSGSDTMRFPNWVLLFGALNKCACKDCQTVFGAGAYLVDLLQYIQRTVGTQLLERRPDLSDIEITCTNTNTMLPYIDLVNEILEAVVAPLAFVVDTSSVDQALLESTLSATGDHSVAPAVHTVFAENGYVLGDRAYISRAASYSSYPEWNIEDDAWRFRIRPQDVASDVFDVTAYPQTSETNDSLEVFPEHYNAAAYAELDRSVFPMNLPLLLGKEEVDLLLRQKRVRLHEIREAFTTAGLEQKLTDGVGALAYLNLSDSELAALLGTTTGRSAWEFWGFDSDTAVSIPDPEAPTEDLPGTWTTLLARVPVFLHRSGLGYQELLDLLETQFIHIECETPAEGLFLTTTKYEDLTECNYTAFSIVNLNAATLRRINFFLRLWRKLGWTMRELDVYLMEFEDQNVPVDDLVKLALVKRLSDELDVPPLALFTWWRKIDARRTERIRKSHFDEVFLHGSPGQPEYQALEQLGLGKVSQISLLDPAIAAEGADFMSYVRAALKLTLRETELIWDDVIGSELTVANLTQLYRLATFCRAAHFSVVDFTDMVKATDGVSPFTPNSEAGTSLPTSVVTQTYKAFREIRRVQAVQLSADELGYLLRDESLETDKFVPRQTQFDAAAVRMVAAIAEIATKYPEEKTIDANLLTRVLAEVMPVSKVDRTIQILQGPSAPPSDPGASPTAPAPLASAPATTDPGYAAWLVARTIWQQQMADYYAKKAAFDAWQVLDTTTGLPKPLADWNAKNAANRAFLVEYFAPLLSAASGSYLDFIVAYNIPASTPDEDLPLAIEADLKKRFADTLALLRPYLLERARTAAATTVASEIIDVGKDTVDALLNVALSTVANASAPAIDDWKAMLAGGWERVGTTGDWEPAEAQLDQVPFGQRRTSLVIPKDGAYRFIVVVESEVAGTAALNVTLGADEVALNLTGATVAVGRNEYKSTTPVARKAGTVVLAQFNSQFTGTASADQHKVSLYWQLDNTEPSLVPVSAALVFNASAYVKLHKAARIVSALKLTKTEQQFLYDHQGTSLIAFSLDTLPLASGVHTTDIAWADLAGFVDLLALNRSVALKETTLFEFWAEQAGATTVDGVAELTGWKSADIETVLSLDWATTPTWGTPDLWYALLACMSIVRRLDLRASMIQERLIDQALSIATANQIRNTYHAQFTKSAWKDAFKPQSDRLRQRKRDALVGYLTAGSPARRFFDANDLYGYYLIDVAMEPDTLISRIKLALNSAQLYMERVFLGLEADTLAVKLDEARQQWAWMRMYRVWEANRKVFLYPENWIEPELRDDKTPFFKELEEELIQQEISDERAKVALANYMEKVTEVSNLEVVGSCTQDVGANGINYILHVVGRTRSQSHTFFYRTHVVRQLGDGYWTPWSRVELDIKGDVVVPAIFNGHLHLAWLMVLTKQKPKPLAKGTFVDGNDAAETRAEFESEIKLMWSQYAAAENKWLKTCVSKTKAKDPSAPTPYQREIGDDQPSVDGYHIRVDEVNEQRMSFLLVRTDPSNAAAQSPKLLGRFNVWAGGKDTFDDGGPAVSFSRNLPDTTLLKTNAAEKIGSTSDIALRFKDTTAFFLRNPESFRIFGTNLSYFGDAENKPFFYETPTKSYFGRIKGVAIEGGLSPDQQTLVAEFQTFNHPLAHDIRNKLLNHGPQGIMDRKTQALPVSENYYYDYYNFHSNYYYNYYGNLYLGYHIADDKMALGNIQRKFEIEYQPGKKSVPGPHVLPTVDFSYGSSFGIYNWELFFHVPMLIADQLTHDLKFEDAMRWLHYVFDPKLDYNDYEKTKFWALALPNGCKYWNFLPFFANKDATESLSATMGLREDFSAYDKTNLGKLIDAWRRDPFNPHLIARQRIVAYQKNVVMKYLDNLIAWADQLFRQDTFEAINEATQLYILAAELLGPRPQVIEPLLREPRYTYRDLQERKLDDFSNAIAEVEYMMVSNKAYISGLNPDASSPSSTIFRNMSLQTFYFAIPRNEKLDAYWDMVGDRLFKIRNSMNIDGVKRQLALFEPPIDPALLVKAAAAGLDLSSILSQMTAPLPHYRFNVWLGKAIDLCNELKSFGGALLSALEKKDAESLQLLRQDHEIRLQTLVQKVRQLQIDEANANIEALTYSRKLAEERHDEYKNREKVNSGEKLQLTLTKVTTVLEVASGLAHTLAGLAAPIPDADAGLVGPFPLFSGKLKIGTAINLAATAVGSFLSAGAAATRGIASIAGMNASYDRRWEDWKLQERLALMEMDQIDKQMIASQIRLKIAEQELANHEKQMEQSEEVRQFLQDKYTNRDLYIWMISQLSTTFRQVYKLAFDVAKTAERALQFELGIPDASFIQYGYMDSLKQGLLTGEKFIYDLKRMEIAYLERNKRELEIQKPISLASLNGDALQELREKGYCNFEIPELLYDLDFAGHYFRRIRAVRVTIPCVTGPHTNVSASLRLLGSTIRTQSTSDTSAEAYPYQGPGDPRFCDNLVGIQSIATSSAQNDAGLFELNFRDERYLPFEGAGAISRWRLELPGAARQFDYNTISDVVLHISYTAREAGGSLAEGAKNAVMAMFNRVLELVASSDTGAMRAFSLKKEFPDVFHQLLTNGSAQMTLLPEHFPYLLRSAGWVTNLMPTSSNPDSDLVDVHVQYKLGVEPTPAELRLSATSTAPAITGTNNLTAADGATVAVASIAKGSHTLLHADASPVWTSEAWQLVQADLELDAVDDIVFIVNYTVTNDP